MEVMRESYLTVKNLTKIYGTGESSVTALDDVSFAIAKGECVAIFGKSGSGKSTLLNMLGTLDNPDRGEITINKETVTGKSAKEKALYRRRKIGFIYQSYHLVSYLSVKDNILMPAKLDKRKIDKAYFDDLVEGLGIGSLLDRMPDELSGGQKQRAAIGRAMIMEPDLILADEPTGNLDSETTKEVMELLMKCRKDHNSTILIVTHDRDLASYADRILLVSDGKVAEQ